MYIVDNYPISIADQEIVKKANHIIEKRMLITNKETQAGTTTDRYNVYSNE